jgi:hypothetical protein
MDDASPGYKMQETQKYLPLTVMMASRLVVLCSSVVQQAEYKQRTHPLQHENCDTKHFICAPKAFGASVSYLINATRGTPGPRGWYVGG